MTEGWCPRCGEPLSNVTLAGFGYCPEHGRQPAEFYDPRDEDMHHPYGEDRFDTHDEKRMKVPEWWGYAGYDFGGD